MRSFRLVKRPLDLFDRLLGCGCLIATGLLISGMIIGAMMGDYGGPPEGAVVDSQAKALRILLSLAGLGLCFGAAAWLLKAPRK